MGEEIFYSKMSAQRVKLVVLIILSVYLGLLADWLRIDINWLIDLGASNPEFFKLDFSERVEFIQQLGGQVAYNYQSSHEHILILNHLSLEQLIILKWLHTVFITALFFWICRSILNALDVKLKKELFIIYIGAFSISFLTYLIGKLTLIYTYDFSRKVIGFLQTIIPAVILYFYHYIKRTEK